MNATLPALLALLLVASGCTSTGTANVDNTRGISSACQGGLGPGGTNRRFCGEGFSQ